MSLAFEIARELATADLAKQVGPELARENQHYQKVFGRALRDNSALDPNTIREWLDYRERLDAAVAQFVDGVLKNYQATDHDALLAALIRENLTDADIAALSDDRFGRGRLQ